MTIMSMKQQDLMWALMKLSKAANEIKHHVNYVSCPDLEYVLKATAKMQELISDIEEIVKDLETEFRDPKGRTTYWNPCTEDDEV